MAHDQQESTDSADSSPSTPLLSTTQHHGSELPSRRQRVWRLIQPEWLTRDMTLLLCARTCMSSTRALAGIIVPIYLAILGFGGLTLGVLFTATALVSALLTAMIGLLSDRIGRKPFLVITPLLAAIAGFVYAFSHTAGVLFIFAVLGSFGRGAGAGGGTIGPYQPAEQALLADAVPARHRNSLFGRIGFASSLGALIGGTPLVTLAILLARGQSMGAYHIEFLFTALLACCATLLALPIHEAYRRVPPKKSSQPLQQKAKPTRLTPLSWSILIRLWITNSVNGLAVGFFGPFITYWFYRRYGAGPAEVGALYTVINLAAMVVNLVSARIAARLGLVRAIVISRALQAILIIPMVIMPFFWLAGFVYLLRMMVQRLGLPLRQSYVMGVVPQEERGRVGALSNLPSQATSALSPTLAGYLFDHVALSLPFDIGAILQGINTLLFFLFFRYITPPEEQKHEGKADVEA